MNIVFYISNLGIGGAERVIVQLATDFSKNGDHVAVATSYDEKVGYTLSNGIKRYVLIDNKKYSRFKKNKILIDRLRNVLKEEKADILISFMGEPNIRSVIASKGLRTRCVISVRNEPLKEYPGKLGAIIRNFILPLADGCVFQTTQAQKAFPKRLQKKSKIILNDVNEIFFRTNRSLKCSTDIISVGRLANQKNHELLIKAFSKIAYKYNNINLKIYGEGPLHSNLQKLIESLRLSGRVYLMGTVDNIQEVMKDAGMFVLSSDFEGLPNALMEAMAIGLPVISTDCPCGGPNMLIKNYENGILVKPGDENELSNAMEYIIKNQNDADKMGLKAKKTAEMYKPEKIFNDWSTYIHSF